MIRKDAGIVQTILLLAAIRCANDVDFAAVEITENHIAYGYRQFDPGRKQGFQEFWNHVHGDRNIAFDRYADAFVMVCKNDGGHDASGVGQFLFCICQSAGTGVAGNGNLMIVIHGDIQMTSCGTVDADFVEFFHFQQDSRLKVRDPAAGHSNSTEIISAGLT